MTSIPFDPSELQARRFDALPSLLANADLHLLGLMDVPDGVMLCRDVVSKLAFWNSPNLYRTADGCRIS